jgi:hypothetical protein
MFAHMADMARADKLRSRIDLSLISLVVSTLKQMSRSAKSEPSKKPGSATQARGNLPAALELPLTQQNENNADWVSQDGNKDLVKRKFGVFDAEYAVFAV